MYDNANKVFVVFCFFKETHYYELSVKECKESLVFKKSALAQGKYKQTTFSQIKDASIQLLYKKGFLSGQP